MYACLSAFSEKRLMEEFPGGLQLEKSAEVRGYPLSPLNFVTDENILISVCV